MSTKKQQQSQQQQQSVKQEQQQQSIKQEQKAQRVKEQEVAPAAEVEEMMEEGDEPPQMADIFFEILSTMFTKDNVNLTEALLLLNENVKVNNQIQSEILEVLRSMNKSNILKH